MPNRLVCQILDYIDININSKIEIDDISRKFYYNRFYIMKLFKREIGVSIINYINFCKVYNAVMELNVSNNSLLNIGLNNGFYSLEYFSEMFKKVISVSPKEYRKIVLHKSSLSMDNYYVVTTNIIFIKNIIDKGIGYRNRYNMLNNHKTVLTIFK